MNTCKPHCSTQSCPFAYTDESERVQNYGCLPTPMEIIKMRVDYDKTWACHSDPTVPCLGAVKYLKTKGLPYKVVDDKLMTLDDNWERIC